jgi:hypothetical protein
MLVVVSVVVVVEAAVSVVAVSVIEVSTVDILVSVIVESPVEPDLSDEQAATDKEIAKAKKPNLNKFFITFCFKF